MLSDTARQLVFRDNICNTPFRFRPSENLAMTRGKNHLMVEMKMHLSKAGNHVVEAVDNMAIHEIAFDVGLYDFGARMKQKLLHIDEWQKFYDQRLHCQLNLNLLSHVI